MNTALVLAEKDRDLLVEMLCCIVAADKKVSGKEVQCISDTLSALGCTLPPDQLKTLVVKYCQAIHKHTPTKYLDTELTRFTSNSTLVVRKALASAAQKLMESDGEASEEERRVVGRLTSALAAAQASPDSVSRVAQTATAASSSNSGGRAADDREPWKVATAIVLFFPLGFYWLWKHPTLSKSKVWWRCGIAWVAFAALMNAVQDKTKTKAATSQSSTSGESQLAKMRSRLRIGMTAREVEKAIGRPQAKHRLDGKVGLGDEQWTYLDDSLGVVFTKGKVTFLIPAN